MMRLANLFLLGTICIWGSTAIAQDNYSNDSSGSGRRSRNSSNSRSNDSNSNNNSGSSTGGRENRNSQPATDRDKQRSNQRRDNTRNKNNNQTGGTSTGTPAPKTESTVKGKAAAPASSKGTSGGGSAHAATTIEFKMKPDPNTNLLLLESVGRQPTLNINVVQGESVVTRAVFQNPRHSTVESVDISLKYDPLILKPSGIDDSALAANLAEPALAKVDSRKGIVQYHARLANPISPETLMLFKVEWDALKPIGHTRITFMNTPDYPSRVLKGDVNVLVQREEGSEVEVSENTGLLGADFAVLPDRETAEMIDENDSELSGISLAHSISRGTAEGGITLSLRPRKTSVAQGEDFLVDVIYNNPSRAEMDTVKLKIKFDPKVLEAVDYDVDNWITQGVNIFDGAYHEDLPFDHHLRNEAMNSSGLILYKMGFGQRVRVPSSGVIATIRFKALAPAGTTEVYFDLDDESKDPETALSFLGFNLIGEPGNRTAAVQSAVLSVSQ